MENKSKLEVEFDEIYARLQAEELLLPIKPDGPRERIASLTERVKKMQTLLEDAVFGQNHAISVFTSGYFQAELLVMTDKNRVRPRATYLFAGPSGVGKTFLAEKAAEILRLPFMRFDMSEYIDKEANIEFCGSDKVYKNGKPGNVTGFVADNPRSVLLFDEVEKAHENVIHLFLQMLDAGRLRDNYTDQEVSFQDTILIFTTNAGRQLYEDVGTGDFSNVSRKVILKTLQKEFPAAICSRFASGNVVMFNHIPAHNLRKIVRQEVLRHARNFEREVGVTVDVEERVFTALMLAEGGTADARAVRGRAASFFDDELYELFRLSGIGDIENIKIGVKLPKENKEIYSLFVGEEKPDVLLFSNQQVAKQCARQKAKCHFVNTHCVETAADILYEQDIKVVLLDFTHGQTKKAKKYLNIEDVESEARDLLWYVRQNYPDLPIYLLQTPAHIYDAQERTSFFRLGVRGILDLASGLQNFSKELNTICSNLHQQASMERLARANKLVTFETAQRLSEDGKTAEIELFDFELETAVDPEDSKNILSNVSKPNVKFDQVIGAADAKRELQYFVEYLRNPKKYLGTGVKAPKGVLLYGPAGTGKTMLAKAMASESNVTFITAEGNQFLKRYVGEGPETVHALFRTARKYAPSILFIDEIDAIAKERRGSDNSEAREATLTAFLTEMDGFRSDTSKPVFVLAATNFDVEPGKEKSLDASLIRRFDRKIHIDLPNREDRVRYMQLLLSKNETFAVSDETVESIAVRSTGMSLAELDSVFELSLRSAIRSGMFQVTDAVLEEAFETYRSGEEKKWDVSQLERIARHEAGHTFLCWNSGEVPSYVTIVARANRGGYMQHGDNEGKAIYTREELLGRIRTALGGRAAELVYYGEAEGVSTGAGSDLTIATDMAQRLVCTYGMDDAFGLAVIDSQTATCGELSCAVRSAVNDILSREMQRAVAILKEQKEKVDLLVEALLSKNHLTGNEIEAILCKKDGDL